MSLSKQNVATIVDQFRKMRAAGSAVGAAVTAIAGDFDATESAVRYHLKAANLIGEQAAPVDAPEGPTDAELGIGEDDAPADPLAALMASPQFKTLLDAAVAQRMKQMGVSDVALPAAGGNAEFSQFLQKMERMIEAQTVQQPGYIKPLTPDELAARAQGYVDMLALIAKFRSEGRPPLYLLGTQFYAGDQLYEAGDEIRTYLPPAESFQPMNDAAVAVYTAMLTWIGGASPGIGDRLAAAMVAAKAPPLVTGMPGQAPNAAPGPVERVVGRAPVKVGPTRQLGTLVPEQHTTSMGPLPGATRAPAGPTFVA